MFALISFIILFSYTAYYLSRVGLLPSHSDSYFALNKKFDEPVLFLEYWVFTYPYAILLIINL